MTSYFDVSGGPSELVVAPAALVASPEAWEEFDRQWNDCLDSFGVTALHMNQFAHSVGEFKGWDWDRPKRNRFINSLLWIIENLVDYTGACGLYVDDYRYVDREYQVSESMRPYTMGCLTCSSSIVNWAQREGHDKNELIWVFEKGDQDQNDLRKRWDIAYPEANVSPLFYKKRAAYPDKNKCKPIRPFEAADLIAFENLQVHRLLLERLGEELYGDELRRPMQRMMKWESAQEWMVHDLDSIEKLCLKWRVPVRSLV
jgi:hypothetical protein